MSSKSSGSSTHGDISGKAVEVFTVAFVAVAALFFGFSRKLRRAV